MGNLSDVHRFDWQPNLGKRAGRASGTGNPANCAVIEGLVIDPAGEPVAGVRVYTMAVDRPPRGRVLFATTDKHGAFSVRCAEPGKNRIYVSKEEDGYGDTAFTPFLDSSFVPIINAIDQHVVRGIEVRLPPRSGLLIAHVLDSQTLKPIPGAKATLCRSDSPTECYPTQADAGGQISLRLPPVRVTLMVSASGYEDRFYSKASTLSKRDIPVRLLIEPKDRKEVTLVLRPSNK